MTTLTVALPGREYDILIQRGLLSQAGERVRAALPEARIRVDAKCCAGVTPESHQNALETMKMCQVEIDQ